MAAIKEKPAYKGCIADKQICVVLENMRSLFNVGAIFRTSDGAGVSKIYLCGITGVPPRPQIEKTALGAEKTVPWEYKKSALKTIKSLKKQGYQIIALERAKKSKPFHKTKYKNKVCLVVGNEISGIGKSVLKEADRVVFIPMRGKKESLNVAVAFGIGVYQVANRLFVM